MEELVEWGNQVELFKREGLEERRVKSYIPSCFVICPLPIRSLNSEVKEYVKKYNNFELRLVGTNGIPGGKIARDFLMLFTTEAVYRKNIILGEEKVKLKFKSLTDLQQAIGMNGRNNGERVIDVLEKFSGCSVYFQMSMKHTFDGQTLLFDSKIYKGVKGYGEKGATLFYKNIVNVPFIYKLKRIDLLKGDWKRGEPVSIDIDLTNEFVEMVKDNAVPVDFTVYKEIQGAMVQDLYVWLVYKNYNNRNLKNEEVFVSKKNLIEQFGEIGGTNDNLKYSRILESLMMIKKNYYEGLNYEVVDNGKRREKGIILHKSPFVIKEKDVRYVPLLTGMA